MTGFTSLPINIGSCIISEWIKLKDLVRLDSACNSHLSRSAFLCYCKAGTLSTYFVNIQSMEHIQWFINRKLKFRKLGISLVMWQEGIDNLLSELLDSIGSHVKEIKISHNYESPLSSMQFISLHTVIGEKCINIKKAEIMGPNTDIEIAPLFCGWKSIQELDISCCNVTSAICYFMVNICKNLKCLLLFCNIDICDSGITALAGKCPELEELHIIDSARVTGSGLINLIKTTPKLSILSIQTTGLTETDTSQFRNLHDLNIFNCPSLTDTMVASIVQNNPLLNRLTLDNCPQLTATVVLTILQGCPQLYTLSISNVSTVDRWHKDFSSVVKALINEHYPQITGLNIILK